MWRYIQNGGNFLLFNFIYTSKVIYIYIYIYRERERERERDYFEILKFIILFYLHYFQSYDHKNILKNTLFFYIILQQFITNTISGPITNPPPQFTF